MDPKLEILQTIHAWLPRARGDGPQLGYAVGVGYAASPRTRGWTRTASGGAIFAAGFPAHAGMDPYS